MPFFYEHYQSGRYEEALADAMLFEMPDDFRGPLFLAATYGQLGRVEEAEPAIAEFRRLGGELCRKRGLDDLDIDAIRQELIERHAFSPALADHLMEGLELAGL